MQQLVGWFAAEGWNPGVAEGPAYFALDDKGLFIAEREGSPVGCVYGVKTGDDLGHLGGYFVAPSLRGRGLGLPLFEHALQRLGNRTIGLDAVPAQRENYQRKGFRTFAKSYRARFRPAPRPVDRTCDLIAVFQVPMEDIAPLDHEVFGTNRIGFLREWMRIPASRGVVAIKNSRVVGYGHIRPAHDGFRAGPLVADSVEDAGTILRNLCQQVNAGVVDIDVCAAHPNAEAFSKHLGLETVFETARMYRGAVPRLEWAKNFAMACMEVG